MIMIETTDYINRSHSRSIGYGISPDERAPRIMLDDKAVEKFRIQNQEFLDISIPNINDLLQMLGCNNGCVLMLTDSSGVILEIFGDAAEIKKAAKHNLKKGVNMHEKSIGTNAIGVAIKEGQPVQVTGNEHFLKAYQRWSSSAAPIYDANNVLIGIINLTTEKEQFHPFMLALVGSTAKVIENRIHNSSIQSQLYNAQQYAFSIMNNLSYGLIAIDLKGMIQWVNDNACRSLNIRRTKLINTGIDQIFQEWPKFKKLMDKGEQILYEECNLITKNTSEKYLINSYSISNQNDDKIGYVVTFRPFSRMLSLVSKYSTTQMSFTFDQIVYKSNKMHQLVEYSKNIANTPSTILITGESGTGKEVFAQSIHYASARKNNPFIAINCGAISSSLIESELFGYEDGAFTGAARGGKPGKFEMANKGTLFLDEIGEMPQNMQVKLLRVLQDNIVTRVGGGKLVKVDVRLIAATNKNLEELVKNGKFREDLFYRISVIPLHLPALKERKIDILPLFRFFLRQKANKLDRPIPSVDPKLVKKIVRHDWPGNIRELENFAEKTVILQGNPTWLFPVEKNEEVSSDIEENILSLKNKDNLPSFDLLEKTIIEKYLEHFDNNVSRTAKTLGLGRNTLYQKIQKYQIKI